MCVKVCEGGQHHLPGSGCIPLCRPLWGNRTTPTTLWQRWPAGDISDSFDSARSCGHRKTMKRGAPGCVQWMKYSSITLPFVNALLTEAVGTGQDEVCFSIHADTALFFISQLLHSAAENTQLSVQFPRRILESLDFSPRGHLNIRILQNKQ